MVLALVIGFAVMPLVGALPAALVSGAIFSGGTLLSIALGAHASAGVLKMALQTEVWVKDIQETLFEENEFLNLAVDHSEFLTDITVHIPQSGAKPNVVKNRTENVAEVKRRTDTELTYNLDNYTTDPFLVKNIEELQISYAKRQSILGQHIATLGDVIAVSTLNKWAVSGSTTHVLRTSGADTAMMPHATATGTRNLLTVQDLALAAARMDFDKAPKKGRFIVVPTAMFYGLFTDKELLNQRALIGEDMLKAGVVAMLHGFKIIVRGEVVRYTSAAGNVLRASDAAPAATDCAGAICFSRFMVTQAVGEVMVYLNEKDARAHGDIMSAEANHGAHFLRPNNVGRVSIAQTWTAEA